MMSNCLSGLAVFLATSAQSEAPASQPGPDAVSPVMLWVTAAGLVVLLIWIVRWIAKPAGLALANTPGRDNGLTPAHVVLPLLLFIAARQAASKILGGYFDADSQKLTILLALLSQPVWAGVALVVASVSFRHGLGRGMGLTRRRWVYDSVRAGSACLAVYPVSIGLTIATAELLGDQFVRQHQTLTAIATLPAKWKFLAAFSAVVLAPLAEELFFRGLLQSMLRRYLRSPWPAIIVTSVLFGLLHYATPQNVPALIVFGAVLGYIYERSGRLWPAILAHAIFNAIAVADQLLRPL